MRKGADEFNTYGIGNPDGVQKGFTDFKRLSFDNDEKLANVKELPTKDVKEISSYDEYPKLRNKPKADAPKNSNGSNQQQNLDHVTQQSAAAQAVTQSAVATTSATLTLGALSVSGAVAAAVVTLVMVAAAVANAFSFVVSMLSATYSSLAFEVAIENNEDNQEFRAVLYDMDYNIVQELSLTETQVVLFEGLTETTEYRFVVYNAKGETVFDQKYMTPAMRDDESAIKIETEPIKDNILAFTLSMPQSLANNAYTLRVVDQNGKQLYVKDDTKAIDTHQVVVPDNVDILISVSFGNRVAYQIKVSTKEAILEYEEPVIDWSTAQNGSVWASFVLKSDPTVVETVEGTYVDTARIEPTFVLDGSVSSTVTLDFKGRRYSIDTNRTLPAECKNYTFDSFRWTDAGLDEAPAVSALFISNINSTTKLVPVEPEIGEEHTDRELRIHYIDYTATLETPDDTYTGSHSTQLTNYSVEVGETQVTPSTGLLNFSYFVNYDGLEEPLIIEAECDNYAIRANSITYDISYRGDEYPYVIEAEEDYVFEVDNLRIMISDDQKHVELLGAYLYIETAETYIFADTYFNIPFTKIRENAFSDSMVRYIELPDGVVNFEEGACANCSLEGVDFRGRITSLPARMFEGTSVSPTTILENNPYVTRIEERAFASPQAIDESIEIPNNVTYIGDSAFAGWNSISSITLPFTGQSPNATGTYKLFGFIFGTTQYEGGVSTGQTDGTTTKYYYIPQYLSTIIYTGDVIQPYAFYGVQGQNKDPGEGYGFELLTDAQTISTHAFENSYVKEVVTRNLSGITIGAQAFKTTDLLTKFDSNTAGELDFSHISTIGTEAFSGAAAISLVIPNNVTSIGAGAFGEMPNLENIETAILGGSTDGGASNDVLYFGYVFSSRTWMSVSDAETATSFSNTTYYLARPLDIVYTGTVIESYALSGTSAIDTLTLTNNLETVLNHAFYNTVIDGGITIPNTVTSIGSYAFASDSVTGNAVVSLTFEAGGDDDLEIDSYAFSKNGSITSINLPTRTTALGDHSLEYCGNLESYSAPFVGNGTDGSTFADLCAATSGQSAESNTVVAATFKEEDGTTTPTVYWPANLTDVTFTGAVVPAYAFYSNGPSGCLYNNITLSHVVEIGNHAFAGMQVSNSISIDFDTLEVVGESAFESAWLSEFTFTDTLRYIGNNAFKNTVLPNNAGNTSFLPDFEDANAMWELENISTAYLEQITAAQMANNFMNYTEGYTLSKSI